VGDRRIKPLFPGSPRRLVIRVANAAYNLACYQSQLGALEGAWRWLGYAMDKADPKEIKLKALDDPHLEPLWRRIGELGDK